MRGGFGKLRGATLRRSVFCGVCGVNGREKL